MKLSSCMHDGEVYQFDSDRVQYFGYNEAEECNELSFVCHDIDGESYRVEFKVDGDKDLARSKRAIHLQLVEPFDVIAMKNRRREIE